MEKKTQLQMRIESSAQNNKAYSPKTHFLDLGNYRLKDFIEKNDFRGNYLSEEDIKSGKNYLDVKPAIQTRLAQMEYEDKVIRILQENKVAKKENCRLSLKGKLKLVQLGFRNEKLRVKAVSNAVKRNGGLINMILKEYLFPVIDYALYSKIYSK